MTDDYEVYEKECKVIREINKTYLAGFEKWLKNKGLAEKTINKHVFNIDVYINNFLLYYDALDVRRGCHEIYSYLGDWFIRKTMWSSCSSIKSTAASMKKFYAFLLENNVVEEKDYITVIETIKDEMPEWLDEMKRYDEMSAEDYYNRINNML